MISRIALFALAALLFGAHFLRVGNVLMVALCSLAPLLFFVRRRWVPVLLQFMAYCAAGIWVAQAIQLAGSRQLAGRPWLLATAILGAVALVTVAAGLLLNSRVIRQRYDVTDESSLR